MPATKKSSVREKLPWSKAVRWIVSLLLVLHVLAVFSAPWSFPPPSSLLSVRVSQLFAPYQQAIYVNNGYRFFAPNPGPSHLIRYEVDLDSGETVKGRFPEPKQQWPRLLYHRHFMISETANQLEAAIPPQPEPGVFTPEEEAEIRRVIQNTDGIAMLLRKGIARQLLQQHNGVRVRLFLDQHAIPMMEDVVAGRPLDDPGLYNQLKSLGEFSKDEL